jgi:hypothetical protein
MRWRRAAEHNEKGDDATDNWLSRQAPEVSARMATTIKWRGIRRQNQFTELSEVAA